MKKTLNQLTAKQLKNVKTTGKTLQYLTVSIYFLEIDSVSFFVTH